MRFSKNASSFVDLVFWLQDNDNWGGADADAEVTRLKYAIQQTLRSLPNKSSFETTRSHLETLLAEVENQGFWEMLAELLNLDIPN